MTSYKEGKKKRLKTFQKLTKNVKKNDDDHEE